MATGGPRSTSLHRWQRWVVALCLASTTTFAIDELRSVAASANAMTLAQRITLLCGHATLALAVWSAGAIAWFVTEPISRWSRRGPQSERRPWLRMVVPPSLAALVLATWPALWIGNELASGAWVSTQWFASGVVVAPLVAAGLVAMLCFAAVSDAGPPTRPRLGVGMLATVVVLGVVDHQAVPGEYPPFHMAIHVAMAALAIVAWSRLVRPASGTTHSGRVAVIGSLSITIVAPTVWLAMSDATRSAIVLRSAVARDWVRRAMPRRSKTLLRDLLATMDVHTGTLGSEHGAAPIRPFAGRGQHNVVLVVVDTLRADALPPARPPEGTRFAAPGDTPRIEAWLADAFHFRRAYSTSTKTHRAMPTMFRSIHAGDDPSTTGVPLGARVLDLGLRPAAVVNDWFIAPRYPHIHAMMEGFGEDVVVYTKAETADAVPQALELVRSFGEDRFFLWVHLYTVHGPGFDGHVLGSSDGGRVARYRRSLRYLDGQFGALVDGLAELGHGDDTIVVLTSDHGEGLGDHGDLHHGVNVFEEDIAVPLAFAVPGVTGRRIDETVGTIDVVPTLVDLLGGPADPRDRGRSLVDLFVAEPSEPERPYFFEAPDSGTVGVVVGHDKLIYDPESDVVHRFDVEGDPDERIDLYAQDGAVESELLRELVGYRPALVADELARPEVAARLLELLRAVDPRDPGAALPLLLGLSRVAGERSMIERCAEIFDRGDETVRLLVARHLAATWPDLFERRLVAWFAEQPDAAAELALVDALARQGQAAFAVEIVAARMGHFARVGAPETWTPWLRLVGRWRKPSESFTMPLLTMLRRVDGGHVAPEVIASVLDALADLPGLGARSAGSPPPLASEPTAGDEVLARARELVLHADPTVRAATLRLAARHRDPLFVELARERMIDRAEDLRVRREAITTYTKLAQRGGIAEIARLGGDRGLSASVVRSLRAIGGSEVVGPLREIAETHEDAGVRRLARRSAEAVERRSR